MNRRSAIALVLGALSVAAGGDASVAVGAPNPPQVDLEVDSLGRVVLGIGGGDGGRTGVVRLGGAGELDTSFAADGVLGPRPSSGAAGLELLPNGKMLVVQRIRRGHPMLRRYLEDGRLDRSFGRRGAIRLPIVPTDRLLVQPDGHIMVLLQMTCECGYTFSWLRTQRFTANGRFLSRADHYNEGWSFQAVGMDAAGRLVVAGADFGRYHSFARLLPSGRFDPSLGGREGLKIYEGSVYETEPGYETVLDVSALAVEPDGQFVLASKGDYFGRVTELRRRNGDGSVDSGFGVGGAPVCAPFEYGAVHRAEPFVGVHVGADGSILAAGGLGACGLVRYLPDGTPDPTFGAAGKVDLEALGLPRPQELAVGPGGEPVLAGWDPVTKTVKVARFSVGGRLDAGFGTGGLVSVSGF